MEKQKILGERGVRNRATHWIKQLHGNGEAVTTAKAWDSDTNLADLVILSWGALNPDMTIRNIYSNT